MPKAVSSCENSNHVVSGHPKKNSKTSALKKTPRIVLEQATNRLAERLQKCPADAPGAEYKQFKKAFRAYQNSEGANPSFSYATLDKLRNAFTNCFETFPPVNDVFFNQYARIIYEQNLLQRALTAATSNANAIGSQSSPFAKYLTFVKMLCAEYSPEILKDAEAGASVRFGLSCFYNYFKELKTTDILPSNSEYFDLLDEFIVGTRLQLRHCMKLQSKIEAMQADSNKKLARHIEPKLQKYFLKNEKPIMPFGWFFKNAVGHVMYGIFTDRQTVRMSDVRSVQNGSADDRSACSCIPSSITYRFNESSQYSLTDELSIALLLQDPTLCEQIANQAILLEKGQASEEKLKMTAESTLLGVMSRELSILHESKNPLDSYEMQTKNLCTTCFTPLLYELALQFLAKKNRDNLADMKSFRVFMDAINLNYKQQQMKFILGIIDKNNTHHHPNFKILFNTLVEALTGEWSKLEATILAYSINEGDAEHLKQKLSNFNPV